MDDSDARSKLGKPEQFLIGLLTMPAYFARLRVLKTKKMFEELESHYQPVISLLHAAMNGK